MRYHVNSTCNDRQPEQPCVYIQQCMYVRVCGFCEDSGGESVLIGHQVKHQPQTGTFLHAHVASPQQQQHQQHLLHPHKKNRRKREGERIYSQSQESASLGHTLLITTQTPYGRTMALPLVFANLFNMAWQLTYRRTPLIEPVSQTTSRQRTMSGSPAE